MRASVTAVRDVLAERARRRGGAADAPQPGRPTAIASPCSADAPDVELTEPVDYPSMVDLLRRAYLVMTDSGGIQEEAPWLGKPILVLRETTERPEGVEAGRAAWSGPTGAASVAETLRLLDDPAAYGRWRGSRAPTATGGRAELRGGRPRPAGAGPTTAGLRPGGLSDPRTDKGASRTGLSSGTAHPLMPGRPGQARAVTVVTGRRRYHRAPRTGSPTSASRPPPTATAGATTGIGSSVGPHVEVAMAMLCPVSSVT